VPLNTGLPPQTPVTCSIAFSASRRDNSISSSIVGRDQFDVAHTKRLGDFVEGNDGRISLPPFEAAQILLTETGARFDILLRQAFFPTKAGEISADQLAHIHTRRIGVYIL